MDKVKVYADGGLAAVSAVVSSLPLGYTLGDKRVDSNNYEYRLVYNAGNSQVTIGAVASPAAGSVGLNSVTVTTTSQGYCHIGAVVCHHATATTGTYFWGMTKGKPQGVIGDASSVATGAVFAIGTDGTVNLMPQSVTTGKVAIGVNLGGAASKTVTTGALSGDVYVSLW